MTAGLGCEDSTRWNGVGIITRLAISGHVNDPNRTVRDQPQRCFSLPLTPEHAAGIHCQISDVADSDTLSNEDRCSLGLTNLGPLWPSNCQSMLVREAYPLSPLRLRRAGMQDMEPRSRSEILASCGPDMRLMAQSADSNLSGIR